MDLEARYSDAECHESNQRVCRICQSWDEPEDLFSPCRCKGSMKYVHVKCLDRWHQYTQQGVNRQRCDVCHFEYKLLHSREWFVKFLRMSCTVHALTAILYLLLFLCCGSLGQPFPEMLGFTPKLSELLGMPMTTTFGFLTAGFFWLGVFGLIILPCRCICHMCSQDQLAGDCCSGSGDCHCPDCKGGCEGEGAVIVLFLILLAILIFGAFYCFYELYRLVQCGVTYAMRRVGVKIMEVKLD